MKNLLLFVFALSITFSSCSSDDNGPNGNNSNGDCSLSPPSWLIGTWRQDSQGTGLEVGWNITANDLAFVSVGVATSYVSLCETLNDQNSIVGTSCDIYNSEQTSANTYQFTAYDCVSSGTFNFEKISSDEIEVSIGGTAYRCYKQ